MEKITALLRPENIRQGVICASKKGALELLGRLAAEQLNDEQMDSLQCFENLLAREKIGSTALGCGIAMPRTRLPMQQKPLAFFLQLETPIDFDAPDNRDVDLIFALFIPEQLCPRYPQVLEQLSERLKEKTLGKQLRQAQSAEDIWQIFECADNTYQASLEQNLAQQNTDSAENSNA